MKKIKIIAEAGVNHNGKIENAIQLALMAKRSGADYVKYQIYKTENLVLDKTFTANYQKKNTGFVDQFKMLKKYELSYDDHLKIFQYCDKIKIKYLASVFDEESLFFLKKFCSTVKIGSGEITNLPLLKKISSLKMNAILSTGASNFSEVQKAVDILKKNKLAILHCHSSYPSETFSNLNLSCIKTFAKKFNVEVGFSDHTKDLHAAILALGFGATIFEKHITLNSKMNGPDHISSMDPLEFINYVKIIKKCNEAIGNGIKKITDEERKNILFMRKSIYAKIKIKKNEKFTVNNLVILRPDKGISAKFFFKLIGKKSKKNYRKFEVIKKN